MDAVCIICKEPASDAIVVTERGKKTLVESSIERSDGLHDMFEKTTPLLIHKACRKNYTRSTSIKSTKRKVSCLDDDEKEKQKIQLRSSYSKAFRVKDDCIFCSEHITQDTKNPFRKGGLVSSVKTLGFRANVIDCAKQRNDKWGNDVIDRLQNVYDLVAAESKYHRTCAQSFFKKDYELTSTDSIQQKAFDELCKFLDKNDECQYSLRDLSEYMTSFLEGNEGYSLRHLKRKLKEHYGDDLVVTEIAGKCNVVSFRDSAYKILHEKWKTDRVSNAESQKDRIIDMAASII